MKKYIYSLFSNKILYYFYYVDLLSSNKEDLPFYDTANSVTLKGLTEIEPRDEDHFYSFGISVIQKRYNAIFMQMIDKTGWY